MAYAFEKIMSLVDPEKTNIFAQAAGNQPQGQDQQNQPQTVQKTTTGSEIQGGGVGSTEAPKSSSASVAPLPAAPQTKAPKISALQDIGQKVTSAGQKLQEEATAYETSEKAKQNYDVSESDIQKGVEGAQEESNKIAQTLAKNTPDVGAFKPSELKNETEILGSDAGLQRLYARQSSPRYTAGQSAYDVMLLNRNPEAQGEIRAVRGQQQAIRNKLKEYEDPEKGLQAGVQKYGQEKLDTSKKAIVNVLNKMSAAIESGNQAEADKWNQDLQRITSDPAAMRQYIQDQGFDINTLRPGFDYAGTIDPSMQKYLTPEMIASYGIDPSQYVNLAGPASAKDFMSDKEATQFNKIQSLLDKIQSLLGRGGQAAIAGIPPSQLAKVDTKKLEDAVVAKAKAKNADEDKKAQQKIDEILGKANISVNKAKTLADQFAGQVRMQAGQTAGRIQGLDPQLAGGIDPMAYVSRNALPEQLDYLSPEDAAAMNAAYEELGLPTRVNPGRYGQGQVYSPGNFDASAYERDLNNLIAAINPPPPPPAPAPGPQTQVTGAGGGRNIRGIKRFATNPQNWVV